MKIKKDIKYPSLVEQAYNFILSRGITGVSKLILFNKMVQDGMLDKNGSPTEKALQSGLVESLDYEELNPIQKFKYDYPQFESIPNDCFSEDDQGRVKISFKGILLYIIQILDKDNPTQQELTGAKHILNAAKEYNLTEIEENAASKLIVLVDERLERY